MKNGNEKKVNEVVLPKIVNLEKLSRQIMDFIDRNKNVVIKTISLNNDFTSAWIEGNCCTFVVKLDSNISELGSVNEMSISDKNFAVAACESDDCLSCDLDCDKRMKNFKTKKLS